MLDNPFSEDFFSPNIQSKSPLAQPEVISSHPITCYLGEETNTHLATTSFQVAVRSPSASFSIDWRAPVLSASPHKTCSIVLSTGGRSLPYSCWPHYSWDKPGCCWPSWPPGSCSASCRPTLQVFFHQAASQTLFLKPVALHGVVVTQEQDSLLALVESHTIGLSPLIQPVQTPL